MPVPCSVAMGELTSGRAVINPRETDSMTLAQLGIFYVVDNVKITIDPVADRVIKDFEGHYEFSGAPQKSQRRPRGTGPVPRRLPGTNYPGTHLNYEQRQDAFDPALDLALQWLELSEACRKFINGSSSADAWDVLDQLDRGGGFMYRSEPAPGSAYTMDAGAGVSATIELYDGFFTADPDGLTKGGDVGAFTRNVSTLEARAIIILHELRHAITGEEHPKTGERDSPGRRDSTWWNEKLFQNCVPNK